MDAVRSAWLPALLLLGGLAILGLTGCSGQQASVGAATSAVADSAELEMAPDFTLQDLDGTAVRFSDTAGQVRLVDFWATWCKPCIEEIPMFKELHEEYGDRGFTMIAVSYGDESPELIRGVVEKFEIPYLNLVGDDLMAEEFGHILGLPTAFLVDGEGRIVERYLGPKPRKVLEARIRELLGLDLAA